MTSLADLQQRLTQAGHDVATITEFGTAPIIEHVQSDPAPWLDALEGYVQVVTRRSDVSLKAVLKFVVRPYLMLVGQDCARFERLLAMTGRLVASANDTRLEQYGLRSVTQAYAGRVSELEVALETAARMCRAGAEVGWFVQLLAEPVARATTDEHATSIWLQLGDVALEAHSAGMHVGFPLCTGLAALVSRSDLEGLKEWVPLLGPLVRAAKRSAYGLFEYGISGLARGGLDAHGVRDALKLALTMFDHGREPARTLSELATPLQLDVATKVVNAGADPLDVMTNGVRTFEQLGWLEDGGERLVHLAIEVHRRGLRELLFLDGINVLVPLERDFGGLGAPALELIEAMVANDLEPGVLMRWTLPRTLPRLAPEWAAAEVLSFARALVDARLAPEAAVTHAARPLVALSRTADDFRQLAGVVVELMKQLTALNIDYREVLFSDVAKLAEAGAESKVFVDLLTGFSLLLTTWSAASFDLKPLLEEALPTAASESAGKPWLLAAGLSRATALAKEGKPNEALALLTVGLTTISTVGVEDQGQLQQVLSSLETKYRVLPSSLCDAASKAASVLAGTDVQKLDDAFTALVAAHAEYGDRLEHLGAALADLATMTTNASGLRSLIDLAMTLQRTSAVDVIRVVAQSTTDERSSTEAIRELGAALQAEPKLGSLLWSFSRIARRLAPRSLAPMLSQVHASCSVVTERMLYFELLEQGRDEAELRRMCEVLPPLLHEPSTSLLNGFHRAKEMLSRSAIAWSHLVLPACLTSKQQVGPLIEALAAVTTRHACAKSDYEVLRDLVAQRGVRAVELLWSLIIPSLRLGVMPSLAAHRTLLERYLTDVGFADAQVYRHFVDVMTDDAPATRASRVNGLRASVQNLTEAVRTGDVSTEQRAHPLFGVSLQHVFPPATSARLDMWLTLVRCMADRPNDVTALWPNGHSKRLELVTGGWRLKPGATDLEVFGWAALVSPKPEVTPRPFEELGWQLLTTWSEGRLARAPLKYEIASALLTHLEPESLPAIQYDSAAQLLAIRQLAGDRLASLVEQALLAARAADVERVERLIHARLAPTPRIGPGLVKAISSTVQRWHKGDIDRDTVLKRIEGQLQAFALPDDLLERLANDVPAALNSLTPKQVQLEPGKEVGRIHAELVGQELQQMSAAVTRWLEYHPGGEVLGLEVTVTKRQMHAPIGLTEGVCVATDERLWNTPNFMHLALWLEGVCMGGVHLLVLEEDGERWLCLPGINPSLALLSRVDVEELVKALLSRARELADEAGLSGVWVPTASSIHSNRSAVSDVLRRLKLPARRTRGHVFSYSPYAYSVFDVWVA